MDIKEQEQVNIGESIDGSDGSAGMDNGGRSKDGCGDGRDASRDALLDVIALCKCAVNGEVPDDELIGRLDLEQLYKAAKSQLLSALTAYALESAGVKDKAFEQDRAKAIRKNALMDAEMKELLKRMDGEGIWYMPLKGAVIADLYPAYGTRQMSDHDILFDADRTRDVRKILTGMGFKIEHYGEGYHDAYFKEPVCNFEMHRSLFEEAAGKEFYGYYRDVKDILVKDEGENCGYHFTPGDFYVFMIAHEYKHYSAGGTGIRSLLDTYVYLTVQKPDMDYVASEVRKLGLEDFEALNRSLAMKLFGTGTAAELTEDEEDMLDIMLTSGTYGMAERSIGKRMRKITGKQGEVTGAVKRKYYLKRLFPDQEELLRWYPLAKYKVLIPFIIIFRTVRALLIKRKKIRSEIRIVESKKQI